MAVQIQAQAVRAQAEAEAMLKRPEDTTANNTIFLDHILSNNGK